jgi:DNA-directed RNA polymerase subunit RPC12/RpoP
MKRLNRKPQDKRVFSCPQCNKRRLTRPLDHVVSQEKREYKTRDNSTVELFVDICDNCKTRNWQRYFEPTKADIRKVLKTMQEEAELQENESLEDLL